MTRKWYIRFSDSKKGEEISYLEYCEFFRMAKFYGAIIGDNFHPHGKTLTVSFPKHFV